MNKEEMKKFLSETKVYVNGKSEKIQEKLFSLGCLWIVDDNPVIRDVGKPFIFIDKKLKLTCGIDMIYFTKHGNREITAEEILALDPPTYRPFENKEECWNEMLKHQPFGWIRNKITNSLYNITAIYKHNDIVTITTEYSVLTSSELLENFVFIDGISLGIKEE